MKILRSSVVLLAWCGLVAYLVASVTIQAGQDDLGMRKIVRPDGRVKHDTDAALAANTNYFSTAQLLSQFNAARTDKDKLAVLGRLLGSMDAKEKADKSVKAKEKANAGKKGAAK